MDTTSDRESTSSDEAGVPPPSGGGTRPSAVDDEFGWPTELVDPAELIAHLAKQPPGKVDAAAERRRILAAPSTLSFDGAFKGQGSGIGERDGYSSRLREVFAVSEPAPDATAASTSSGTVADALRVAAPSGAAVGPVAEPDASGTASKWVSLHERPRHATSTAEWIALAAITVAGVAAVVRSGASPTGIAALDLAYAAAFVSILVLSASVARRWALVAAPVAVALVADGPSLVIAGLGLALAAFLVLRLGRSRVGGGAVGALVGVAVVHLASGRGALATLVPVLACVALIASGYANAPDDARRRVRTGAIGVGVTAGVLVMVAGALLLSAQGRVADGVRNTDAAVAAVERGEEDDAVDRLAEARDGFDDAHGRLSSPLFSPVLAVPILSQNFRAVRDATDVGAEVTGTMAVEVTGLDYEQLDRPNGGVDTAVLASFRAPAARVDDRLRTSVDQLEEVDRTWLVAPIGDRLGDLERRLSTYRNETEVAVLAATHGPAVLGADGRRRYLVLLGNPAEARDLGGHIGTWAEVTFTEGQMDLVEVGGPRDLSLTGDTGPSADLDGYPPSLADMDPRRFPQNWGSDPDLATVARLSAELFEEKTGRVLHGVAYADPQAFAAIIGLTGPRAVPGTEPPLRVDESNAADFLTSGQYEAFASEQEANPATEKLVREVFEDLSSTRLPAPRQMGDRFAPLVDEGRFAFVSLRGEDEPLLEAMEIERRMPDLAAANLLGVVNRNANPSKIDAYLERVTSADFRWDPETGEVSGTVTVLLTNEAPASGLSDVVLGNQYDLPRGTNVTDLALLTRFELDGVEVDGEARPAQPTAVGEYWRNTVRVEVLPGESVEVRYRITGTVPPGPGHRLELIGQPLVARTTMTVTVTSTDGRRVVSRSGDDSVSPVGEGGAEVELIKDVHRTIGLTVE